MKKSFIIGLCYFVTSFFLVTCLLLINPFSDSIKASTLNQNSSIKTLESTASHISLQLNTLQSDLQEYRASLDELESQVLEIEGFLVDYYIDKLSDPTYTCIYDDESIYYTAAENLGQIGKSAIPKLIARLDTSNDYERALTLYALLLASQDDSVKVFAGNDYIQVNLDFDARNHPQEVEIARSWWNKYQSYFTNN